MFEVYLEAHGGGGVLVCVMGSRFALGSKNENEQSTGVVSS